MAGTSPSRTDRAPDAGALRADGAPESAPPRRLGRLAVAAILALALGLRLAEALRSRIAFDDVYALLLARLGPAGIFEVLRRDVDQPLGFLVMAAWRALGGEGELWLKLPWLAFGLGTVLAVILLGREMFDARAGLWAGLILATNPSHVFYSQQASFPVLVWLLLALAVYAGWRWISFERGRDGAAFVALSGLAIFAYYYSAIVVAAVWLWGAVRLRQDRGRWMRWAGLGLLLAVICAPGAPLLLSQLERDVFGDLSLRPMPASDLLDLARKLADNSVALAAPVLALAALPLTRREQWRNASLLAFVVVLPVLLTFQLSREGVHLFILRQWLFALPLGALLIGAGLSRLRWPRLAAVAGILIAALGVRAWQARGPLEEGRLLALAVEDLRNRARPGDLVVCAETRSLLALAYHAPWLTRLRLLIVPTEEPFHYSDGILAVPEDWRMTQAEWLAALASGDRWWGVRLGHAGRDGPRAAAAFDSLARGPVHRAGKLTWWEGAPPGVP